MHLKTEQTVITLSNAIELTTLVIKEVAGNEVADTLNGSVMSQAAFHEIVGSQINKNFSNYTNQGALK